LHYVSRSAWFVYAGLAVVLALLAGCDSSGKADRTATDRPSDSDSLVIELAGADSVSVFDLLEAGHEVGFTRTALGVFVTRIDSVRNGSGCFWIYSLNDTMPSTAADRCITVSGDRVRWHFRRTAN